MFLNFTENEIENAINSKEYMEMKNVFTNKESMDKLEEIVSELKNYDIFDIIARISGLNIHVSYTHLTLPTILLV